MSEDQLLTGYDHIRKEYEEYGKRIDLIINSSEVPTTQSERLDNFRYLLEEWKDIVAAAKNRFGKATIERVCAHLGLDKDGESTAQTFSDGL